MLSIAAALVLLGMKRSSVVHDLRVALAHEAIGSRHFRKVLDDVLNEDGALFSLEEEDLLKTSGDSRGCVVHIRIAPASQVDSPVRECIFSWPSSGTTHVQIIQRVVMGDDDFFVFGDTYWKDNRLVMCGPGNCGGNFNWGWIRSYRLSNGTWRLSQSLQMASGVPPAFRVRGGRIDPNHILAPVAFIHQPVHNEGWYPETDFYRVTYRQGRYVVGPHIRIPSPMTTVDDLMEAAKADKRKFNWLTAPSVRVAAKRLFTDNSHVYVETQDNLPFWSMQQPRLDVET